MGESSRLKVVGLTRRDHLSRNGNEGNRNRSVCSWLEPGTAGLDISRSAVALARDVSDLSCQRIEHQPRQEFGVKECAFGRHAFPFGRDCLDMIHPGGVDQHCQLARFCGHGVCDLVHQVYELKCGFRAGDHAPMALVQLVDRVDEA